MTENAATQRANAGTGCAVILALGAVLVGGSIVWGAIMGGDASFVATVDSYRPDNPASLTVFVEVTNTGPDAGAPDCTVRASDPSGAFSGFDVFQGLDEIQPGASSRFSGSIVIENQGAGFVDAVTAECD